LQDDVEVASWRARRAGTQRWKTAATQAQPASTLRSRRDLQLDRSLERGRGHLRTFQRLRHRDRQIERQIASVDAYGRVRAHRDAQIQVSVLSPALSGGPLPGEAHARAALDAGRDLHAQ